MSEQIWQRLQMLGLIVCLLLGVLLCAGQQPIQAHELFKHPFPKSIPNEGVQVFFIQLTSGEATLIRMENDETVLIDTGSGASVNELFAFFSEYDVDEIDHLILTNWQDAHAGNFEEVYKRFRPEHVYYPFFMEQYMHQMPLAEHIQCHPLQGGQHIQVAEQGLFKVLHPHNDAKLHLQPKNNSLVLQFRHRKQRFLFMSDVSSEIEKKLFAVPELKSQILKVGDFGSNAASSAPFLDAVDAHVAIVFENPQDDVVPEVLERLHESWMDVYRVKKHGHILIVSMDHDYEVIVLPPQRARQG